MLRVYKYPITPDDKIKLLMPVGARILTVQTQFGEPQLWALVDSDKKMEQRIFRLARTGHNIEDDEQQLQYVNSFQLGGGSLIFHLFEIIIPF